MKTAPTVLAFDTAAAACSAAIMRGGEVCAHEFERRERGQAEVLVPMITRVMTAAGIAYENLDFLAVTVGPGSFTGLRIGLACARGLAVASQRPLMGVTTLEAVAHGVSDEVRQGRPVLVAMETRREDIYVQLFDAGLRPVGAPAALPPANASDLGPDGTFVIVGSAAPRAAVVLGANHPGMKLISGDYEPDAAIIVRLAAARWQPGMVLDPVEPLYLRSPDTTLPKVPLGAP